MDLTQRIAKLSEDDFRELVDRDLRRDNTEDESQALRSPALVDRWYAILVSMSKSVDGQLAAKREDFEAQKARLRGQFVEIDSDLAEAKIRHDTKGVQQADARTRVLRQEWQSTSEKYSRSRAATLRFKSGLEETLVEARMYRDRVRDRLYDHVVAEERNRLASRVRRLESALQTIVDGPDIWSPGVAREALDEVHSE